MEPFEPLGELATERADPRLAHLDELPIGRLAELMNENDRTVAESVGRTLDQITPALEHTADRMQRGGRLVYVGAGTSGRIGVLDAAETQPTFSVDPGQVVAIIAGGDDAVVSPVEGAEDDRTAGSAAIDAAQIGETDTVIGIASSGRTPFVVAAIERARERGALTVGLSCNTATPLSTAAEYAIEVEVGPEFIAGSTRLKAGTAQKMVLNMFSTISMIQLGKTYGNLMVGLKATNSKLRQRAIRLVAQITGAPRERAEAVLTAVGFDVKVATVMIHHDIDEQQARARLASTGGLLRPALNGSSATDPVPDDRETGRSDGERP